MRYNDGKVNQVKRRTKKARKVFSPAQAKAVAKIAHAVTTDSQEIKHFSASAQNAGLQPSSGTPFVDDLIPMGQGITENTRIANHITPQYFGLRYILKGQHASDQLVTKVRILVVQWKPNSATAGDPDWTQYLQQVSDPWSYRNTEDSNQFKTLYDAKHIVVGNQANEAFTVYGDVSIPSKGIKEISYNDTATTGENKLYLMAISNYQGADTTSGEPLLDYGYRLRYTDA